MGTQVLPQRLMYLGRLARDTSSALPDGFHSKYVGDVETMKKRTSHSDKETYIGKAVVKKHDLGMHHIIKAWLGKYS